MIDQSLYEIPRGSKEDDFRAHQDSHLFYWSEKMVDKHGNEVIGLVSPDTFHSPCIAVPAAIHNRNEKAFLFLE